MSEHAAALPLPGETSSEREALLEAGRLTGLGELVRGFAHEINNPLFGMLGLVELLMREIEPGTKAHERLSLVQQSGLEIKRITHSLLGFARAEPEMTDDVSLREIAETTVELVRCTSAGKSVEVREQYADDPLLVRGSTLRLGQVFLSLLVNAQQALPTGGTVTVELERDGDWAVARVTDTGAGIDSEARSNLFEPFATTKDGGTGLGLAASLEIARAHGGDLIALTSVSAGASFVLRLPMAEAPE
ncbi:MAG: ATP-binding protein [Actinomycetota bacterium]